MIKRNIFQKAYGRLQRLIRNPRESELVRPTLVKPGLKVHIGCGPINIEGWVNIDARFSPHVHIQTESIDLSEFADGVVGEIYLSHVVEHFSFAEVDSLLRVWYRKLAPGGVLRVSVPDFDKLLIIYDKAGADLNVIRQALMGGQDYPFNFHKNVFSERLLSEQLRAAGFSRVEQWDTLRDFGIDLKDWSTGAFEVGGQPFEVSLNLKATK